MGESATRSLTVRRSRPYAYLLLARFSNLPTVWTNVLAGTIASGAAFVKADAARIARGGVAAVHRRDVPQRRIRS